MDVKRQVLLVESDSKWSFLIKKSLVGFKVMCVDSAQTAMDKLDEKEISFLVINLDLPKHNGIELLNERASHPDIASIPCVVYGASEQMNNISKQAWEAYRVFEHLHQAKIAEQLLPTLTKLIKNAPVYS